MMRVLHIMPGQAFGGVPAIVGKLAEAQRLAGLDARVFLIYSDPVVCQDLELRRVPFSYIGLQARYNPALWRYISQYVLALNPDIVCFHMPNLWLLLALRITRSKECPWINHVHTFPPLKNYPWLHHGNLHPSLRGRLKSRFMRLLMHQQIDCLVGVSQAVTMACQQYYGSGSKAYRTIYNGIDLPTEISPKKEWPNFMGNVSFGRPLLGFGTRIAADKGIKEFIETIPYICRYLPEARFVLAGEGPMLEAAQSYRAQLGLEKKLSLPGFIRDMPGFWSALDFALFTSPREACPMSVIEAQGAGIVVAGYLTGSGSDEILIPGKTGLLVPWGQHDELARKIAQLWDAPDRYSQMSEAARQYMDKHFSLSATCKQSINLYQELVINKLYFL